MIEIQYIKGVGPKRAQLFHKLGIYDVRGLFYHAPRRYLDRSTFTRIKDLKPGQNATIIGTVADKGVIRARRGFSIFNLLMTDGSGYLLCKWFNQPYLAGRFEQGQNIAISGLVKYDRGMSLINPEYELMEEEDVELIHTGRIVPFHPSTAGLSPRQIRTVLRSAIDGHLDELPESLPQEVIRLRGLLPIRNAIKELHFPQSQEFAIKARERLAFEELFYLELMLHRRKMNTRESIAAATISDPEWESRLKSALPFEPTRSQRQVIEEVNGDLRQPKPMHRLLQGDVGSGKTVVAFAAIMQAARQGLQSALMAPTELLAEQHYMGLKPWLDKLSINCALLTSQVKSRPKKMILDGLSNGSIQVCIGTHALIQEQVMFQNLSLAVVDEQHRFGVAQRAGIRSKGCAPHLLVMTATPIPRTLAMTVYGDLDISVISELPPGRQPITTRWTTETNRSKIYGFLNDQVKAGRQAYVIYPVIDESEKTDLKAAVKMHGHLAQDIFPHLKIGLVHGRLAFEERQQIMDDFRRGKINVLVSTTVIEVGIDIPNATIMLIEHAERFGLSQLHQLRGRVGRGQHRSYCILLAGSKLSPEASTRLDIMQATRDGFKIAEEDLKLRGPGEFWGTRQHGLPALKIADLLKDASLIEPARQMARRCLDPGLSPAEQAVVERNLMIHFPDAERFIASG